MLVPLTDSTNPYAAMMLELIRIQQTPRDHRETRRLRVTVSRPNGIRRLFARVRLGRQHAPASTPA